MKSVVFQVSKQMPFVQTSSESDDVDSNHTQMLDIKPYNVSKEYGLLLLNNIYKKKGLNHSQSFFMHDRKQIEHKVQHDQSNDNEFSSLVSLKLLAI